MGYQAVQGLAYPPDKPANLVDINTARQNFLTQLKNSQSVISHECCLNEQLLLSAPAWKSEKLDWGNLLVTSLQAIYSHDEASLNLVAKHLGLR